MSRPSSICLERCARLHLQPRPACPPPSRSFCFERCVRRVQERLSFLQKFLPMLRVDPQQLCLRPPF